MSSVGEPFVSNKKRINFKTNRNSFPLYAVFLMVLQWNFISHFRIRYFSVIKNYSNRKTHSVSSGFP